ncbi:hypothetical protein [Escherichia coli]|uniref:hypothetical protein n=1 Tax=Escherichia coli TaxID=562 RepID=UPI0012FF759C|nr:hypothetical protein [Escherichia coli]EHI0956403.1 hypothetical protein [Escherichia coli]HCJ8847876.1 hypothetical protein [Escherichia coli]HCJ8861272.1 hypothetical protein [Escherichia coli]
MCYRVIAMYVLLLSCCDSHSARSYMPGAFACATALAFLYDGVFCIDYLDPRMYSFSRDDDDAGNDTPQL